MARASRFQLLAGVLLALCPMLTPAGEIAIPLANGNRALADFRQGDAGKPAIFILHGFLQTYHYSTVQLIADELADNGYTILAPTLTLNIDQRRNGLGCDAIQNHRVANATLEIATWQNWLHTQGYHEVIVIGHSSGSMRLLSYLSEGPATPPALFIATSIGPIQDWQHPEESQQQRNDAMQQARKNPRQLSAYTLAFCHNNYLSPPEAYLSYMQWSEEWVLKQLQRIKVPVHVVLGTADTWLPPHWGDKVVASGLPYTLIDGASHNFTGEQEFEFQDLIRTLVNARVAGHE